MVEQDVQTVDDHPAVGLPGGKLAEPVPGMRVLLVDDSDIQRKLLCLLLAGTDVRLHQAASGDAAVACYAALRPHLILMDLSMRDMGGAEAARRIRTLEGQTGGPPARIVAMTAFPPAQARRLMRDAGMDDLLPKPVMPDDLTGLMSRAQTAFEAAVR